MKKKLLGLVLCFGFICLFGVSNKSYEVSNIVYTENDINLVDEQVDVKGLDEETFHVLNVDGEKVRLLADFNVKCGYSYNFSGDGDVPVAFENSMLYQGLMDGTKTWKSDIEESGGKTNIFLVDAPTIEELLSVGQFSRREWIYDDKNFVEYFTYNPYWIFEKVNNIESYNNAYWTKSIFNKELVFYVNTGDSKIRTFEPLSIEYGGGVRPVLETSIYNLSSDNTEIQNYLNSVRAAMDEKNSQPDNSNKDENKAEVVKVPSTGADASMILTIVGIAVIVIAGVVIWVLVKGGSKKN